MNWEERKTKYDESYFTSYSNHVRDGKPTYTLETAMNWASKLKEITGSNSFLDCGCATGMIVHGFYLLDIESRGIDLSQYAIENSFPEIRHLLQVCDISTGLVFEDNSFDTVISFDLLEHLQDYSAITNAVGEMCRCARRSIFLRQPMTNWQGEANAEIWNNWLESLNPLPHKVRLSLVDKSPLIKSAYPTPKSWEHPNAHPRDFWVLLFKSFGFKEEQLPEEYYIFPNVLGIISMNCLYFIKDN
jgi:SAM-dependent methyltransferase